ncbi:BTB domain-containing protein [Aphelenchoides besseyi]|nr:BTB domain-containing protein [Aphelenchoides besseyi]
MISSVNDDFDLSDSDVSTANDDLDVEIEGLSTALTLDDKMDKLAAPLYYFGVHTEDGHMEARALSRDKLRVSLGEIDLCIHANEDASEMIIYSEAANGERADWFLLAQVRFRTGIADPNIPLDVVDSDVFLFSPYAKPITLQLRGLHMARIRMDLRYIYKRFHKLDNFTNGDLILQFGNNAEIQTYRSLLAFHSPLMEAIISKSAVKNADDKLVLQMPVEDLAAFRELLYQIYPNQRPVYANFRQLCYAAVKYGFKQIEAKAIDYFVAYEHLSFEQKVKDAVEMKMFEAAKKVVYNAEKKGLWSYLISRGFDPKETFGEDVYFNIAKRSNSDTLYKVHEQFDTYNSQRLTSHSIKILLAGHTFYANYGFMAIHNLEYFGRGDSGEYFPHVTIELRQALQKADLTVEKLLETLLNFIHRQNYLLPQECIRPMLIFANVHRMPYIRLAMEDALLMEPPVGVPHLLEHFQLAEQCDLPNLMRASLLRVENSCHKTADHMIQCTQFEHELSLQTQQMICDRLCSGWAVDKRNLGSRVPTKNLVRLLSLNDGGYVDEKDDRLHSLYEINSETAFGNVVN